MRARFRQAALAGVLLMLAGCAGPFERWVANRTAMQPPDLPELRLPVADLHADSLMWARDLLQDGRGRGHADLPRLQAGGVVLQVFTVFTVTPLATSRCLTPDAEGRLREGCGDGRRLNLTALLNLFVHGRFDEAMSIRSTVERRAAAFHDLVTRSQGTRHPLLHIKGHDDLRDLAARRRGGDPVIGALLGLEGAHPLDPGRVEEEMRWLHGLGYRLIAPVHRFDNAFAGSSEGLLAGPLTPAGERLVRSAMALGMVVDAAHLSSAALLRVAALMDRPLIYSHGGIASNCRPAPGLPVDTQATEDCDRDRNLTMRDAAAIARTGGVIGIGYWPEAVGTRGIASIVSAMRRTREALAAEGIGDPLAHLAIGSDFDGFVEAAVDAAGHPRVLHEVAAAFGVGAARRISWENACRALAGALGGARADTSFCAP